MYTITGRFTGLSLRGRDMFERVTAQHVHYYKWKRHVRTSTAQHVHYYRSVHRLIVTWKRHIRTSHRSTCPLLQMEETCSNESPLNMSTITGGRDMFERATAQHVHYYRSVHRLIDKWKRHVRTSHRSTCLLFQVGSPAYR